MSIPGDLAEEKTPHPNPPPGVPGGGDRKSSLGIDIGGGSIKLAARRDGRTVWMRRSKFYDRPTRAELVEALRDVVGDDVRDLTAVGLCAPGMLDRANRCVGHSVNLPVLMGESLDVLVADAIARDLPQVVLLTDAEAAALDLYSARCLTGRLLLLVLGTGVGAAVWDAAGALHVDGESPGHFGQMDVSISGTPVIGPDAGQGSLEGYIGTAALRRRYGDDFAGRLSTLSATEPALLALVRAIRIGHAIYRPDHICLAGGIGNALSLQLKELRESIRLNLTSIARADWTLTCGDSDFHAAIGAAKAAEAF